MKTATRIGQFLLFSSLISSAFIASAGKPSEVDSLRAQLAATQGTQDRALADKASIAKSISQVGAEGRHGRASNADMLKDEIQQTRAAAQAANQKAETAIAALKAQGDVLRAQGETAAHASDQYRYVLYGTLATGMFGLLTTILGLLHQTYMASRTHSALSEATTAAKEAYTEANGFNSKLVKLGLKTGLSKDDSTF